MSPTALFYKEKEYLKPLPHKSIIDTYLTPNRYRVSCQLKYTFHKSPKSFAKQGIPGQIKEK